MANDDHKEDDATIGDMIESQAVVRRRFSVDETPDGDIVVLSKGERSAITKLIAACDTIRKHASPKTRDISLKLLPLLHELDSAYRVHDERLPEKPKPKDTGAPTP